MKTARLMLTAACAVALLTGAALGQDVYPQPTRAAADPAYTSSLQEATESPSDMALIDSFGACGGCDGCDEIEDRYPVSASGFWDLVLVLFRGLQVMLHHRRVGLPDRIPAGCPFYASASKEASSLGWLMAGLRSPGSFLFRLLLVLGRDSRLAYNPVHRIQPVLIVQPAVMGRE